MQSLELRSLQQISGWLEFCVQGFVRSNWSSIYTCTACARSMCSADESRPTGTTEQIHYGVSLLRETCLLPSATYTLICVHVHTHTHTHTHTQMLPNGRWEEALLQSVFRGKSLHAFYLPTLGCLFFHLRGHEYNFYCTGFLHLFAFCHLTECQFKYGKWIDWLTL